MSLSRSRTDVLADICSALSLGDRKVAANIARVEYPFVPRQTASRRYSQLRSTTIFARDGFIDRYFGTRLVFPGTLILLSKLLPEELPAHPTFRVGESHFMFWELWPAVDHLIPLARGGADEDTNLFSTSVLHNDQKGHYTLEELGWGLQSPGRLMEWDGLIHWFVEVFPRQPELVTHRLLLACTVPPSLSLGLTESCNRRDRWHNRKRRAENCR